MMAGGEGAKGSEQELLDVSRSEKGIWLMKVPNAVGDTWKAAVGGGQAAVVGTVTIFIDPLKPPGEGGSEFTMQLAAMDGKGPKEYILNFTPDHIPMHIFSETSQGKVGVEGKVEHKFDMQPKKGMDDGYRQMVKERDRKFNTPKRTLQAWDGGKGGPQTVPLPGGGAFSSKMAKRKAAFTAPPKAEVKRFRMTKEALEEKLFKLFETQEHWTLKQLGDTTEQPLQFLKEVLIELCLYNKRGPHQGLYELKPEFKSSSGEKASTEIG